LFVLLLATHSLWAADIATERWTNGLRSIVQPTTASGVVSVELLLDYSSLDEPPELQGLRQVLVSAMLQGSDRVDGSIIRRKLSEVGGVLSGRVGVEMIEFTVTVPAEALPIGLAALAEVVCRPQLSDEGIRTAIQRSYMLLSREPADARGSAELLSQYVLYGPYPFATGGLGWEFTVEQITPPAVRAAYRTYFSPHNAVIAVAGRCTEEDARAQVRANFGLWTGPPHPGRPALDFPTLDASRLELRELPVRSTCVMLTFPVCGAQHEDYLTLRLIDSLLAGGTASRLFRAVREEKRLAYEVSANYPTQAKGSSFSIYAVARNGFLEDTKTALVDEIARLQVETVPEEELQRARAYLKGRYLLSHQYSAQYAYDLAWYELIGLGADYDRRLPATIDAITADEIQRVARAYFTHYYLIVVIPRQTGQDAE
jgi:predicted Zn-dependent peptidase